MTIELLLTFFAGFTFAIGSVNLAVGFSYKRDKSYLFFGLLSVFAGIFLLISLSKNTPAWLDALSITSAAIFYGLFIWFIGEYTSKRNVYIQWILSVLVFGVFVSYFLIRQGLISWDLWEFFAHFTILSISVYGFVAGWKGLINFHIIWKSVYLLFMVILGSIAILLVLQLSFGVDTIVGEVGNVTPLDFFPVFFSLIMGSKLSSDIVLSYNLDLKVKQKEKEWEELLDSINLLIVKLDKEGNVVSINSFLQSFTGYQNAELVGKNWIDLMASDSDKTAIQNTFNSLMSGEELPVYKNSIKHKNGELKSIQWSNLLLRNSEQEIYGMLSIGADITQLESAFSEIRFLKDKLEKENLMLKEEVKLNDYSSEIIGQSDSLMYVIKRALQVSATDSTVLLEGETGVGKELFANMIHRNSPRKHKSFIKVNCASLPKELIESELFGHEKGSFTGAIKTRQGRFELANNGTVFLDEIGELPLELQPKLLRVLQTGEFERIGSEQTKKVDLRVIAATNRNLLEESEKGAFRQDLFFRLNVYPVTIPPLRHRTEDIPVLINHFTSKIGRKIGRKIKHISKADINKLQAYDWPGNVRELENVLERAIINSESDTLNLDESQLKASFTRQNTYSSSSQNEVTTLSDTQKNHIINVLNECNWKINGANGAAQKLGMPPSTLRSKMKKLNIERPDIN